MFLFLSFLLFVVISSIGIIFLLGRSMPRSILLSLTALGAGTILSVSLGHIFPEALEIGGELAIWWFIGGFLAFYLIEEILSPHRHEHTHGDHSHEDPHEHINHVTLVSWGGITLHTLLDGLAIASAWHTSPLVGVGVLIAILIHQIPVSLSLAGILRQSHMTRNIQILLLLGFALAAPLGYSISSIFLGTMSEVSLALATAFAGGSLLYIATADLLPIVHNAGGKKYISLLFFLMGSVGMLIAHEYMGHGSEDVHEHEELKQGIER